MMFVVRFLKNTIKNTPTNNNEFSQKINISFVFLRSVS